ncbi:MAG: GNAT family N-acetyltransferase, partial [Fusobacteriaceae bacterium]
MWKIPESKEFSSQNIILYPLNVEKHIPELFKAATENLPEDYDLFKYVPTGPYKTVEEMAEWASNFGLPNKIDFSVYSKRLKKFVGMCSILNINSNNGVAELGSIWYSVEAQRTEINSETIFT